MTEIEYEVREQDLIAFNEHQLQSSQSLQKSLRRHQIMIPGMLAVIALSSWFYYQEILSFVYGGVLAVAWALLSPLYLRWSLRRQIRKMYTEEEKACILGSYTLRAAPKALVEVNRNGESQVSWDDVLRIEATKRYTYIFITLDTALIIPRETVKRGDLHEFFKEVDRRIEQAG